MKDGIARFGESMREVEMSKLDLQKQAPRIPGVAEDEVLLSINDQDLREVFRRQKQHKNTCFACDRPPAHADEHKVRLVVVTAYNLMACLRLCRFYSTS